MWKTLASKVNTVLGLQAPEYMAETLLERPGLPLVAELLKFVPLFLGTALLSLPVGRLSAFLNAGDSLALAFQALLFLLIFRLAERREIRAAGLISGRRVPGELLRGAGMGVLSAAAVSLPAAILSGAAWEPRRLWTLFLLLPCCFLRGFAVEVIFRGCLLTSTGGRAPLWLAVLLNGVLFAAARLLGRGGVSPLLMLNCFLGGVLLCVVTVRHENLHFAAACHGLWTFTLNALFGLAAGGLDARPAPLAIASQTAPGVEGTLPVTALLALALLLSLYRAEPTGKHLRS